MLDALIIGSGFGGAMAAHRLVQAGWRVLMLERGDWVPRGPHNWDPAATMAFTPQFSRESAYRPINPGWEPEVCSVFCVGGASVFYGGVSFRFREEDFTPAEEIVGRSGAAWPFRYGDLEPFYGEAERLLGVAGDDSDDPTKPPRRDPYPFSPPPTSWAAERFGDAARDLGLRPFPLPLAINFNGNHGRTRCDLCRTCDAYVCAVEAKNDTGVAIVRPLLDKGLELRTGVAVTKLIPSGSRITEVRGWDRVRGEEVSFRARHVILAAGALASPHLLLASGLERLSPAPEAVGAYLMRHCCGMSWGLCPRPTDPAKVFHKQLAVFDYYRGDPAARNGRRSRLGSIQQMSTPQSVLVKAHAPWPLNRLPVSEIVEYLTGTLVIAEDEPQAANRVTLDWTDKDAVGLPRMVVRHFYTSRDLERRQALIRRARRIQRRLGALSFYHHKVSTFSHGLGTVRMGTDPASSPLDDWCRYRGLDNLLVVDASALPTSGAVNPSLTVAAVALRAADHLASGSSA